MSLRLSIGRVASEYLCCVFGKLYEEGITNVLGKDIPAYVDVPIPVSENEPYRYQTVPDIISYARKAALLLEPTSGSNKARLDCGYNTSRSDAREILKENTLNVCKWYALVVLAFIEMKNLTAEGDTENEINEKLKTSTLFGILNDAVSSKAEGETCVFLNPPEEYDELVGENEKYPQLNAAVERAAQNTLLWIYAHEPHYDTLYESDLASWLGELGFASFFISIPYFFLVTSGAVEVTPSEEIPATQEERKKVLAPVCPRRYTETDPRFVNFGHDIGTAPPLDTDSLVCPVHNLLMRRATGEDVDNVPYNFTKKESLPFVDSLSYVTLMDQADFHDGKNSDMTLLPWQTYRILLNWYGGGVFNPLTLRVNNEDGITMSIVRPITYTIWVPDPTKIEEYSPHYLTWTYTTSDYSLSVADLIEKALKEGEGLYSISRYNRTVQDAHMTAAMIEGKNFVLKCLEAQHKNKEVEKPLLEVRTGSKPTEYDAEHLEDLSANARDSFFKKKSAYAPEFNLCIIEAGTLDKFTSANKYSSSSSTSYSNRQNEATNPGWVGLQNLGNTCYMNSALQCILHAKPFINRISKTTEQELKTILESQKQLLADWLAAEEGRKPPPPLPENTEGSFVLAFNTLIENTFDKAAQQSVYSPSSLKKIIGKRYRRYDGYEQQDAIEFVNTFIDTMQEELNVKTKVKDYRERSAKDEAIPVSELSKIYWEDAKKNNPSFIFDQWYGQMQSNIQCLKCGNVSTIFDAFSTLAVSLKETETNPFDIPVIFVSDVKPAVVKEQKNQQPVEQKSEEKKNDDDDDQEKTETQQQQNNEPLPSFSGKYVHSIKVRVRLSKGSSARDMQCAIFDTLVKDPEAIALGLDIKLKFQIGVLRINHGGGLHCASPVDRVMSYEKFLAYVSDDHTDAEKKFAEYHVKLQAYEKEQRELKEAKEKKEKEEKKKKEEEAKKKKEEEEELAKKKKEQEEKEKENNNNKENDDDQQQEDVKKKDEEAKPDQSTSQDAAPASSHHEDPNNNTNDNNQQKQQEDQTKKEDDKKPLLEKPLRPKFHLYTIRCVPSEQSRINEALMFPIVVPASITHKELYQHCVDNCRSFLRPKRTEVTELSFLRASVISPYSMDAPRDIRHLEENVCDEIFDDGKSSSTWGIEMGKSNYEIRNLRLIFDDDEVEVIPASAADHSSLEKVPGANYKPPASTLESVIADSALPQDLNGMDQLYCGKCKSHEDGRKTETVMVLPPLLVVQLKRFYVMPDGMSMGKISTSVPYPEILEVSDVVSPEVRESGKSTKYRLFGAIHHSGSLNFGHYTATVAADEPCPELVEKDSDDEREEKRLAEEEELKKKQEEEEAERKRKEEEQRDEIEKLACMEEIPVMDRFKDPDVWIRVEKAKIEVKKRQQQREAVAVSEDAAGVENNNNNNDNKKVETASVGEEQQQTSTAKKQKKIPTKRVWLDCNDSWVSKLDSFEKAMNGTSVYIMFYERVSEEEAQETLSAKTSAAPSPMKTQQQASSTTTSAAASSSPASGMSSQAWKASMDKVD